MTSAATTKREAVATAIRTGITSLATGWAAYASPVDIVSLPAIVIGPGEPYRAPTTFGGFGTAHETLRLVVHLFANRATGNTALDLFDEAQDAVMDALDEVSYSTRWSATRVIGNVQLEELPVLAAAIDIEVL